MIKTSYFLLLFTFFIGLLGAVDDFPDDDEDAQSIYRPLGMEVINDTQRWEATTDANALDLQTFLSPYYTNGGFDSGRLNFNSLINTAAVDITPTDNIFEITPSEPSNVRVYFLDDRTGRRHSLGAVDTADFTTYQEYTDSFTPGVERLAFPTVNYSRNAAKDRRNSVHPLKPLDFVDLGTYDSTSELNLFILEDGGRGWWDDNDIDDNGLKLWASNSFYDVVNANVNTNYHFKFYQITGRNEILVAFERNPNNSTFNDLYFMIQVIAVPEPSTYFLIGLLLSVLASVKKSNIMCRPVNI